MSALTRSERAALLTVALLTALAGVANYQTWAPVPRFALATVALAGLAWIVSFATEQLGNRAGPAVTGLLQSTLGNLPELFVVIFALQKSELVVAQTAIIGSILANALLVLGLVIVVGASRAPDGIMRFYKRLPRDTAALLLLAVFIIVLLGLSLASHDPASHHVKEISVVGAICLLFVYATWVVPYLRGDSSPAAPPAGEARPAARIGPSLVLVLLLAGGAASAFVSDWFVSALQPSIEQLHISQAFAGLVIVAIAGNAVENVVGIQLAARNKADYALSVILQSPLQIALVLAPVIVLAAPLVGATFTLVLSPLLIAVLAIAVIVTVLVVLDGESTWFEGAALVGLYVMIAAGFWWG